MAPTDKIQSQLSAYASGLRYDDLDADTIHAAKVRVIDALGALIGERLALFDGMLDGRDYLFGAELTAADCAAWPFLRYAVEIEPDDDEPFHYVLHERMTLDERHPNLSAWITRVRRRPRA